MSEKTNPFLKPGNEFLANFLSRFGAKPGKFSVAGINLPEFGVTENTVDKLFPNREAYNKEVIKKNEELNKKGSLYGSNFPIVPAITTTIANAPQNIADKGKKVFKETDTTEVPKLGDSFDQDKYFKGLRNLMVTNTGLREFELNREAKRNMAAAQQYLQLTSMAAESAARRRLMEDQFSPTKISQQRLRAQQGEANLMNAIANQQNAAVNAARSGINPRGRAGGA